MRALLAALAIASLPLASCARAPVVYAPGTWTEDAPAPASAEDPEARLIERIEENKLVAESPKRPRSPVTSTAFRVEDLPEVKSLSQPGVVGILAPFGPDANIAKDLLIETSNPIPHGPDPKPGIAQRTVIRVKGKIVGRLSVGSTDGSAETGVTVTCGGTGSFLRPVAARWETLEAAGAGPSPSLDRVRYTATTAWFDFKECKAAIIERVTAELPAIVKGQLYAFRLPKKGPGEALDAVVVVGPRMTRVSASSLGAQVTTANVGFFKALVPLRHGGGGSLVTQLGIIDGRAWHTALGTSIEPRTELLAGVDIAQSVGDESPLAVAYARVTEAP